MAGLTLYPAIDVLDGRCVGPRQGDSATSAPAEAFDDDPVAVARRWQEAGAAWLHVMDLDGALAGEPRHLEIVRAIADATGLPIQVGGGLCSEDAVAAAFEAGAQRVILGMEAAREPELLAGCLARWNERIAVAVNSRGGQLTVAGWLEVLSEPALAFAKRLARMGVRTLVLTNVARDSDLAGGDAAGLEALRAALPETQLIAAGGFSSLDDVRWLAGAGMDGAVLGQALYDGTLDLAEALRVVSGEGEAEPDADGAVDVAGIEVGTARDEDAREC